MLDWVFKSTQIYAPISVIYLLKTGTATSSIPPQSSQCPLTTVTHETLRTSSLS